MVPISAHSHSATKIRPVRGNPPSFPAFPNKISGEDMPPRNVGHGFASGWLAQNQRSRPAVHAGRLWQDVSPVRFPLAAILKSGNFLCVIKSFADDETRKIFDLEPCRKLPPDIQTRAKVKLDQLHAASELNHLRIPPSNRLEKLSGNLRSHHSIRINQQWRLIFIWKDNHAHQVEITDYH